MFFGSATSGIDEGENNTASNVGVGGVGLFKQKVGVDLQFRNINAASSRISVVLDDPNNEVDIDVVESNIDHGNLLGLADDDHLQYLTEGRHDSLPFDNPHSVSFTQAVAADAGTDITVAEAETLTDGSNADLLHVHTPTGITGFDEAAQDAVGGILTDTASIDFTYNDGANTITADVLESGVDHDALFNFVANEHIDWTLASQGQIHQTNYQNLQGFALQNVLYMDLEDSVTNPSHFEGRIFYDENEHTLSVYNDEVDVTHNLGQEGFIRVYNDSGATITNGQVVYISGGEATEQRPTIALGKADADVTSRVVGVATHDIENNSFGYITEWGLVNDLNLSAFSKGDVVYLSATIAGAIQNTIPLGATVAQQVGYVIDNNAVTGRLLVDIRGIPTSNLGNPTITLSFQSESAPHITVTSAGYQTVSLFEYRGTDNIFDPTSIKVIASTSNNAEGQFRIFDTTNTNVIAESAIIAPLASTYQIIDLGVVSNLPNSSAIFEIQAKKTGGAGSVNLAAASFA